jgi:hypothetical protein
MKSLSFLAWGWAGSLEAPASSASVPSDRSNLSLNYHGSICSQLQNPTMPLDELLQAANQLNEPDLETLTTQILTLRARRKTHVLDQQESELLQTINQGIPELLHHQYQILAQKRNAETIEEEEYEELLALSDRIEQLTADRVEALTQLAEIRQISLLQLMDDLGIQPPAYV